MDKSDQVEIAISLGFSIINMVVQYLRDAGVADEIIEANWPLTKEKHSRRPSEELPEVPE